MPFKEDRGINYGAFIALGVSIMGLGVTLSAAVNPAFISFIVCGAIFMIIGARAKWAEKEK
jgi:predicted membrane channel-forming protein YqfA (hemolysin III family)